MFLRKGRRPSRPYLKPRKRWTHGPCPLQPLFDWRVPLSRGGLTGGTGFPESNFPFESAYCSGKQIHQLYTYRPCSPLIRAQLSKRRRRFAARRARSSSRDWCWATLIRASSCLCSLLMAAHPLYHGGCSGE